MRTTACGTQLALVLVLDIRGEAVEGGCWLEFLQWIRRFGRLGLGFDCRLEIEGGGEQWYGQDRTQCISLGLSSGVLLAGTQLCYCPVMLCFGPAGVRFHFRGRVAVWMGLSLVVYVR